MHEVRKKGKEKRKKARDEKGDLFNMLNKPVRPDGHAWHPKGRSMQCQNCQLRLTMHSTSQALRDGHQEACSQAGPVSIVGGQAMAGDKTGIIQQMVNGNLPNMSAHQFQVQTNYVVCTRRSQRALRNSAKEEWAPPADWLGSPTHRLWRKGGQVQCVNCRAEDMASKQARHCLTSKEVLPSRRSCQHVLGRKGPSTE